MVAVADATWHSLGIVNKGAPGPRARISFEFFPPRTDEQQLVLESTWQKLAPLRPEYLSVTFGAGGSTLDATRDTVLVITSYSIHYTKLYDIYALCQRLQDGGVTINRPPREGRMAFVRSPDGISIELLQKGGSLPPQEPWASMPNTGSW